MMVLAVTFFALKGRGGVKKVGGEGSSWADRRAGGNFGQLGQQACWLSLEGVPKQSHQKCSNNIKDPDFAV